MFSEYGFLMAIAGILAVGAISPGPSFFVVAKNALNQSRWHGVACAVGTGLGVAIFAVLASFGVTSLINNVPSAYLVFKILGGAYLLFLAYKIWAGSSEELTQSVDGSTQQVGYLKAFMMGLVTQLSNPKTALVIAGIFAAFVPKSPPENTWLLVAMIAFFIDFGWYAFVAIGLSSESSRKVYFKAKTYVDRTVAIFLGLVFIRLMFSKLD